MLLYIFFKLFKRFKLGCFFQSSLSFGLEDVDRRVIIELIRVKKVGANHQGCSALPGVAVHCDLFVLGQLKVHGLNDFHERDDIGRLEVSPTEVIKRNCVRIKLLRQIAQT